MTHPCSSVLANHFSYIKSITTYTGSILLPPPPALKRQMTLVDVAHPAHVRCPHYCYWHDNGQSVVARNIGDVTGDYALMFKIIDKKTNAEHHIPIITMMEILLNNSIVGDKLKHLETELTKLKSTIPVAAPITPKTNPKKKFTPLFYKMVAVMVMIMVLCVM